MFMQLTVNLRIALAEYVLILLSLTLICRWRKAWGRNVWAQNGTMKFITYVLSVSVQALSNKSNSNIV
jgi:hypothetical protein